MRPSLPLLLALLLTLPLRVASAEPLSAARAVRVALTHSPELTTKRNAAEQAANIAAHAAEGTVAAPSVGLGAGVRRNALGGAQPELTVSVTQPIRLTPVGRDQQRHAQAVSKVATATRREAELDVSREVLSQWLDLRYWERVVDNRQRAVERAQRLFDLVRARVAVGAGQPGDDALAESSLGRQQSLLDQAQLERERVHSELQLLLATPPSTAFTTEGDLPKLERAPLAAHPTIDALKAEALSRRAQAQLALSQARAPLGVGLSVTREGPGDWVVLGQLALPLPFGNTATYAAAQTTREVGALEFEAEHLKERQQWQGVQLERRLRNYQRLLTRIAERELAPAERAMLVMEHQFTAGKATLQELLLSQDRIAEAALHLLQAHRELGQAQLERAWLDGSLLVWARGQS